MIERIIKFKELNPGDIAIYDNCEEYNNFILNKSK